MGSLPRHLLGRALAGVALLLLSTDCQSSEPGAFQCVNDGDCPPACSCETDMLVVGVCENGAKECGGTCDRESACPEGTECLLDRTDGNVEIYACKTSMGGTGGTGGAAGTSGTGGTGGTGGGASCDQKLDFDLVCPGDVAVGESGQVTVQGYDAKNINQLSFGAAGGGSIDPPAFQVPESSDSTTTIPEPPFVFTFKGLVEGDVILTITTFDVSQDMCFVSKKCNFNVVE